MRFAIIPLLLLSSFFCFRSAAAELQMTFPHPERIKYDARGLQIEGKDTFLCSGAFHYFRCPKELWGDRFRKIKEAGFNGVETYVPWNLHEPEAPASPEDFSQLVDLEDLDAWISMAEQFGLYVIIRPGPYICSEWAGGGYPQWLVSLKKPANWPVGKSWLQTDDPEYLAWSRHWYLAVCRVVAKHQITRKAPGEPGVILFQIENEYERVNWISWEVKRRHLEALANTAQDGGIEVPLVTCWTRQSRNVRTGPLAGVFDFVNTYPKWNVAGAAGKLTDQQLKEQPGFPLGAMELQGGWYSEVGGRLSENIDGVAPVQMQNLTLYMLQRGYSIINYYMLCGGTNFDDWASRETTTSYDFAAAIREHGGVGEKYRRAWGLGHMLQEHGARLMRSELLETETVTPDPAVEIAVRRDQQGGRYVFVRTSDRLSPHQGQASILEKASGMAIDIDFDLERFGSKLLYLPPGITDATRGEWLPKAGPEPQRPTTLPDPVVITQAERLDDPLPTTWTLLEADDLLEKHGILGYHFLYYRITPPRGQPFKVLRLGDKVVGNTKANGIVAWAGDGKLAETASDQESVTFAMPAGGGDAILLFEHRGLHQHTTPMLEQHWANGIRGVISEGRPLPLAFAAEEKERGLAFSKPKSGPLAGAATVPINVDEQASGAPLTWYRMSFELPEQKAGTWVPWHLRLVARGNGFIYVNGHCLGRTWQAGPQRDFYLPECWLNFGPGKPNAIAVCLRPVDQGVGLQAASLVPAAEFAEKR